MRSVARSSWRYLHFPQHAGFQMARNKAAVVELAGLRELPNKAPGLAGCYMRHVRLVVLHARMLSHERSVLFQLLHRAEHHLMHRPPRVVHAKADGFALL